jgi:hypothetical protein
MKRSSAKSYLLVGLFLTSLGTWEAAYGGLYHILSANSGRCLTPIAQSAGSQVMQYTCFASPGQLWDIIYVGSDQTYSGPLGAGTISYARIKELKSGLCLDVIGGSGDIGVLLQLHPCHGGANQLFGIDYRRPYDQGRFVRIRTFSNNCLDVPYASLWNYARIQQYTCNNGLNQQWVLAPNTL